MKNLDDKVFNEILIELEREIGRNTIIKKEIEKVKIEKYNIKKYCCYEFRDFINGNFINQSDILYIGEFNGEGSKVYIFEYCPFCGKKIIYKK